ncbi:MAG: DUF493 domain-containing protein [Campylobacter sp.]|nr:DUF493 domain-containing protein [Campylobacter sp.]
MANICETKPKIDYPNFWEYKVIFDKNEDVITNIKEILKGKEFKINFSKQSSGGKYQSFNVSVMVHSDADRFDIFKKLKNISKFIL